MNEKMYKLAIEAINNLIAADEVEDDLYADALMVKQFMMDTAAQIPVPVPFNKGVVPVMETTLEGAQKRIASVIDWYACFNEGGIIPNLEYIGVFLDSVGDEMAAMTSAYNSLHDRYVAALADANQLQTDFDTVDSEAAGHLADKIRMTQEINKWKDNFEAVDMASARRLEEKIELQKEIDSLRKANLNNLHAANDNR